MGNRSEHKCGACGTSFVVDSGGGFMFDQLHCEQCGKVWSIGHRGRWVDLHLGFIKGLDRPYAVAQGGRRRTHQARVPGAGRLE